MATQIVMPKLGLTMEEGTILRWMRSTGEAVRAGEVVLEVEGDKTTAEVECPADGILLEILVQEGETVEVGAPVGTVGAEGEQVDKKSTAASLQAARDTEQRAAPYDSATAESGTNRSKATAAASTDRLATAGRVLISPRARRLAEQHGIDWTILTGSDAESGRIQEQDVRAAMASSAPALNDATHIPFTSLRATIARRLQRSVNEAPHIHLWTDVDATEIRRLREEYSRRHHGKTVSFGSIFIMAAARSLTEHPRLNATVEERATVQYAKVALCMAIGLEDGVVAPVIRDAASLSLAQTHAENSRLVSAAKGGTLRQAELEGGTFTVTSLGATAVRAFTPVLNPPQVGILSVGAVEERPAVYEGALSIRPMVTLGLTVDHRAVDGIPAAAFLDSVKERLEAPHWMLEEETS